MSSPRSGIKLSPLGPASRVWPVLGLACICLQTLGQASVSGQTTRPAIDRLPGQPDSPATPAGRDRSQPILSYHRDQPTAASTTPLAPFSVGPRATGPPRPERIERAAPIKDRFMVQATANVDMLERTNEAEVFPEIEHENQLAGKAPPAPGPRHLVPASKGGRFLNGSTADAPADGRPSMAVPSMDVLRTAGAALAIAIGLFLICAWLFRRSGPRATSQLPKEVVRALGRTQLGTRQFVQLLQVGNKLVLVSVTPERTEPITEVTDPAEIHRILGLCMCNHAQSTTAEFQQVLDQLSREPASGFLGNEGSLTTAGRNRA